MASAPEVVQINPEEYDSKERPVASKLAATLNNFFLVLSDIFNKRFTFAENFSGDQPLVRVKGGESISFRYKGPGTPRLLLIGQYRNVTNQSEILTTPVSLPQWVTDGRGNVVMQAIPGLTAGHFYDIMLIITTG